MPASSTVSVYDAEGKLLRRLGPERFSKPGWLGLAFPPGDRLLLAWPHHWTCRGLVGQPLVLFRFVLCGVRLGLLDAGEG
jgi:hypothetical protein